MSDRSNSDTPTVACPTCKKPMEWSSTNAYRPFCCERCKLIDLGEWASEGHKIPGQPVFDDVMSDDLDPTQTRH